MLLNNFKAMLIGPNLSTREPVIQKNGNGGDITQSPVIAITGTVVTQAGVSNVDYTEAYIAGLNTNNTTGTNVGQPVVVIGSGNTPATLDDYRIENPIPAADMELPNIFISRSGNKLIFTKTVTNISANNIEVNEIGIGKTGAATAGTYGTYLLTRTVLPETVVIAPNATKTFTVTIDFASFVENVTNS